ncbi:Uncharacterised protein [Salmonella enterica subsp. arizonae]|uniref:Uncharacterized protein n=1 Tax=Salmonella enterica subsp. arizonae TaxID=59203 RepID=A0A379RW72_SALER|nr:Uncharacterised protein [Salmonella enterica subsp. arizonae]
MMSNSTSRGELWLDTLAPNAKRLEGCARPCRPPTAS